MKLYLISAFDEDKNIGFKNNLPWKIKEDLLIFKKLTENNIVIMGKNTFISLKKPLKNRINIVLSSDNSFKIIGGIYHFQTLEESLAYCEKINLDKKVFIIGGRYLYEYCLGKNIIDYMYISKIKGVFSGDVKFPEFNILNWNLVSSEEYENFSLCLYQRI